MKLPEDGKERSELIYDHRVKNARPIEERFKEFYLELDGMLLHWLHICLLLFPFQLL